MSACCDDSVAALSRRCDGGYLDIRTIRISACPRRLSYPIRIALATILPYPDSSETTIWFTPDSVFAAGATPYSAYNLLLILAHVHTHTGWMAIARTIRTVMTPAGDVGALRQATPCMYV